MVGEPTSRRGDRWWAVVDKIWFDVNIDDGPDAFLADFTNVPREAGLLFAVHWLDYEVTGGGFRGFFESPAGVLAPEAVEGYREIGLPMAAGIIEEAMSFFGELYPRGQADRVAAIERYLAGHPGVEDPFEDIEKALYESLERRSPEQEADAYAGEFLERTR